MKIIKKQNEMRSRRKPVVLAAGFFDGLHRGHQGIIRRAIARARKIGGQAWCMTFEHHPLAVLSPGNAPRLLTSTKHRLTLLKKTGLDGCLLLPFDKRMAALSPEEFVSSLVKDVPSLKVIVVGENWRFGHRGKGDGILLKRLGSAYGFSVLTVKSVRNRGQIISSTVIRQAVERGDLLTAGRMLGRPYSVAGCVTRGRTIGRRLGFATANIVSENEVMLPRGVYAVKASVGKAGKGMRLHDGIMNLGVRPTYGGRHSDDPVLELHLLDVQKDLYGRHVEVFFISRLRAEKSFASESRLKAQIAKDAEMTRRLMQKNTSKIPFTRITDPYIVLGEQKK